MNVVKTITKKAMTNCEGTYDFTAFHFDKSQFGLRLVEYKFEGYTRVILCKGNGRTANFTVVFEVVI